jgi:ligand-binding sensor domain-containing protein
MRPTKKGKVSDGKSDTFDILNMMKSELLTISWKSFGNLIIIFYVICLVRANAQTISWAQIQGPYAGSIQLLTVDPSGNIFAATSRGMFRSTDGGESWHALGFGLEYGSVFLITDSANDVYTGNGTEGLYISTDKGTSWTKTNLTGGAYSAAVLSGGRICAGGYQTISISNDHGKTWTRSQITTDPLQVLSIAEDNLGNIYAGLQAFAPLVGYPYGGGVYISSDSGETWKLYGMSLLSVSSIAMEKKTGRVFISVGTIYSASPKSSTWKRDDAGIPYPPHILVLQPDHLGEIAAITTAGIFVYNDSTSSWENAVPSISSDSIVTAYYSPKGTSYAGTPQDGVFSWERSMQTWIQRGIYPAPVTSLGFDGAGVLYAGTDNGIYEPGLSSGTWLRVSDGLPRATVYQIHFSPSDRNLYASTSAGLYYLRDGLSQWNPGAGIWTYDFIESPDNNKYIGTSGGIMTSFYGGSVWDVLQTIGLPLTSIYCLAADSSNNLFAGTLHDGVFESTDGGDFWTQVGINSPFIFYTVKTMEIDNADRIFAGTDTVGAYYSADMGTSWNRISSITGKGVTCFLVNRASGYFAGTLDRGIFMSTDRGLSWSPANDGLTDPSVTSLLFDQQGYLYAATDSGIFRSTGVVSGIHQNTEIPSSFNLYQNYPNPFNPTTVISYQLSAVSNVTLKVYDVLGREVETLVNEKESEGAHSVNFNASTLPSGVYFYRLAAGDYVETKKMVLIK